MDAALRDWLLECPALATVSGLALDAARLGLIDLRGAIAEAVSVEARLQTMRFPRVQHHRLDRFAKLGGGRPGLRVTMTERRATLVGFLPGGPFVCEGRGEATILLYDPLPETVFASLAGRPLAALVSHPLLDERPYVVERAESLGGCGSVSFAVEGIAIERVRPRLPSLSRAFSARRVRDRARSR